jgi:hypothetical protein
VDALARGAAPARKKDLAKIYFFKAAGADAA